MIHFAPRRPNGREAMQKYSAYEARPWKVNRNIWPKPGIFRSSLSAVRHYCCSRTHINLRRGRYEYVEQVEVRVDQSAQGI